MARLVIVLALALVIPIAGCGGADVAYTEVTSAPEGLPIPDGGVETGTGAASDSTDEDTGRKGNVTTSDTPESGDPAVPTDDAVEAPTAAPTTAPVTPAEPIVPEDTTEEDTGAAAPPTTDTPETPTDTGGGATAPSNDQFCADNPGACNN